MTYKPKTDWQYDDVVTEQDLNRIEQGIKEVHERRNVEELERDLAAHKAERTSLTQEGHVKLTSSISSNDTMAVTPKGVSDAIQSIDLSGKEVIPALLATDLPSAYPMGDSVFYSSNSSWRTSAGFPSLAVRFIVITSKANSNGYGTYQKVIAYPGTSISTPVYGVAERVSYSLNTWGEWYFGGNSSFVRLFEEVQITTDRTISSVSLPLPSGYKEYKYNFTLQGRGSTGQSSYSLSMPGVRFSYYYYYYDSTGLLKSSYTDDSTSLLLLSNKSISSWGDHPFLSLRLVKMAHNTDRMWILSDTHEVMTNDQNGNLYKTVGYTKGVSTDNTLSISISGSGTTGFINGASFNGWGIV